MAKIVRAQIIPPKDRTASVNRLKEAKAKQASKIAGLRDILMDHGCDTLQKQAKVLGISRSTTWYLLGSNYKGSGLSAAVIKRMLASPKLPEGARALIQEYIAEKLLGAYGHERTQLRLFRKQLGYPEQPAHGRGNQDFP